MANYHGVFSNNKFAISTLFSRVLLIKLIRNTCLPSLPLNPPLHRIYTPPPHTTFSEVIKPQLTPLDQSESFSQKGATHFSSVITPW